MLELIVRLPFIMGGSGVVAVVQTIELALSFVVGAPTVSLAILGRGLANENSAPFLERGVAMD